MGAFLDYDGTIIDGFSAGAFYRHRLMKGSIGPRELARTLLAAARGISDDFLDAARLEGAGELKIYWKIVLPLLRPVLTTLGIVTFLATWNDFIWPLIVLTDERRYTLPVALASLVGEHVQDTELMMAGSVLTVLPVLLLFLLLQKQYIEGITLGGLKE